MGKRGVEGDRDQHLLNALQQIQEHEKSTRQDPVPDGYYSSTEYAAAWKLSADTTRHKLIEAHRVGLADRVKVRGHANYFYKFKAAK